MAIRPLQHTFFTFTSTCSRDTLLSLFCTNPRSLPSPRLPQALPFLFFLRHFAARAAAPLPHPPPPPAAAATLAQKIGKSTRRPGASSKARVYADVNVVRPKEYWDYESLNVQWG